MNARLLASVVLPTHGRRQALLRVLQALARQTAPAHTFEVVVVCDGDVDGSAAACRALEARLPYALRVIEQTNRGPAVARNRGVDAARGDLIIFFDDDQLPDAGLVAAHIEAHRGQQRLVTIGEVLPPMDARLNLWGAWEERGLCRQYEAMETGRYQPTWRQFFTGNAAVRRQHILDAGGFNAALRRAEDVELALRFYHLGLRFAFLPEARGWHYSWRSFKAWLQIPRAYGQVEVTLARLSTPEILEIAAKEFFTRNRLIRGGTWLCAGRPRLLRATVQALGAIVQLADALRWQRLGFPLCSMIYNLQYYDGIVGALGSRDDLLHLLRQGAAIAERDARKARPEAEAVLPAMWEPPKAAARR